MSFIFDFRFLIGDFANRRPRTLGSQPRVVSASTRSGCVTNQKSKKSKIKKYGDSAGD
jgi:hypothetical protein